VSDKPIGQKLSLKPGDKFLEVKPPVDYARRLGELPGGFVLHSDTSQPVKAIQLFVAGRSELEAQLLQLKTLLAHNNMLWVTYHKGASKVKTDIHPDTIAAYARSIGLQSVMMIINDKEWAALRLKLIQA
jgi:hypothetical protein